jgi:hypothetical protein
MKHIANYRQWFEKRLDDAIQATDKEISPKAIGDQSSDEQPKMPDKPKPSGDPNGASKPEF